MRPVKLHPGAIYGRSTPGLDHHFRKVRVVPTQRLLAGRGAWVTRILACFNGLSGAWVARVTRISGVCYALSHSFLSSTRVTRVAASASHAGGADSCN